MENKKISVIVPVYNMEKYLGRCVDSILAQTYENIEVILVDDGSSDASPDICDRYAEADGRVRVIHKANGGLSSARNAGLDAATGDYIGFVDSDDYISPDMYRILAERLDGGDCEIANAMYVYAFEGGETAPSRVPHTTDENISAEQFARELMLHAGDVSVCTKLFRAEIFDGVRFPEGKLNEDLLFMLDVLARVRSIGFAAHIGYYYFVRSGSTSNGYGRAVIDMVGNSLRAKETVDAAYPSLAKETARFALFQHMAYLLLVPAHDAVKSNEVWVGAVRYLRRHTAAGLFNRYLSTRNKLVILMLAVAPKATAKNYQKKRGIG